MDAITNSQASIDNWTQRPARQMLLDGRMELNLGLILLIGNLSTLYMATRPHVPDPPWYWALLPLCGVPGYLLLARWMKWLHERVIPRSGYVAFPERPSQSRRIVVAFFVAGAGLAVLGFFRVLPRSDWIGLSLAIVVGTCFLVMGIQYRLPHWVGLGVGVLSGAAWLFRVDHELTSWLRFTIGIGGALVLTGAWRLWRFLRANPIPTDDTP
jgi:hypothetical protein